MRPLDTRVVVIGAGPAGLSAALALAERGFTDVTVLEKEATVGGKCHSLHVDGHAIDLGANLTTPRYHETRALAERLGMTLRKIRDRRIVNLSNEQFESLADANLLERLVVRGGASVYAGMRHLTGIDRDGYANLRDAVEQPFERWLDHHGLGAFKELFEVLFVAYGYGAMLELPAAYALKFFDPVHLEASVDTVLGKDVPFTMDFEEGFQELWERVDARLPRPTLRSADIASVSRSPRGVDVRWTDASGQHDERFDALILACPLQVTPGFLDTSADEARLFSKIRTNDYYVTVARTRGLPDMSTYVYPYARRLTPGWPTVFYPPVGRSDSGEGDLFVFYAYGGEGVDEGVVRQRIRETLAHPDLGGEVTEFVHTQHWRYFPHVDSEAMRAGFYDELEAMQGVFHTYYVGELLSFTLVELNHRYAKQLVERHFVK
ncbi:MAG: FAD-dependent oxidoreductase [Alphaproteobacteria bacterium]|nr:FAD-dependent oxidoreductase [Alphaproteobacteria bacterium]MCB9695300.1 FAD-dependent oxidoreductase [Alphaproteobacteria bacterium]